MIKLFEIVLLNSIFLTFPVIIYLLYQTYSKTLNKEKNELYLDVALISSFYLIVRYGISKFNLISLLLINIPLITAYIKNRKLGIVFLSTIIVVYYNQHLHFSIIFMIIEYAIYFIIYIYINKKEYKNISLLCCLLLIKCICFMIQIHIYKTPIVLDYKEIIYIGIAILAFYMESFLVIQLFRQSDDILKLYKTMRELQEEKQIRESLFKITHEIKNPIAVCKGYLDMFDVNNQEHSRKYIPIIREEIERVLILLKDFLSITKVKVEQDIIDINLLLEDVIKSFLPLIADRRIKIISHIKDDELYIMADYNRLSQVFVNIIKNSIEALDDIQNGRIEVTIKENKNTIKVKIEDNGIGISPENLKRMKNPFFTTKQNGTGLGMYLSAEIVKAHNGTIQYTSEGKGTTVIVTLPNKKGY